MLGMARDRGRVGNARVKRGSGVIGAEVVYFWAGRLQSFRWRIVEGRAVKKATMLFRVLKIIFPVS